MIILQRETLFTSDPLGWLLKKKKIYIYIYIYITTGVGKDVEKLEALYTIVGILK